jgi:alpha-L-rhamnosidase
MPVGALEWAEGTYRSIRGPVSVRWDRDGTRFKLAVTIPANTTATVYLPAAAGAPVTENGVAAADSPGVRYLRREVDRNVYAIESGSFAFESQL